MRIYKTIVSAVAPGQRDVLWAKPVEGGFTLYLQNNGMWQALKVMEDKGTASDADDTEDIKTALIGSVQDESTANTINGAKAAVAAVVGTNTDTAEDLTLYGLKAYIDSKTTTTTP